MQRTYTPLQRTIVGAVAAAFVAAAPAASAQTTTTTTSTSTSTATAIKRAPTEATPRMIDEAIQRSQARSEKLRTLGTLERFGSEEPFTYDPTK